MYFKPKPQRSNLDKCPVCKYKWGIFSANETRIHVCNECKSDVIFFPNDQGKKPLMKLHKHRPQRCNCGRH